MLTRCVSAFLGILITLPLITGQGCSPAPADDGDTNTGATAGSGTSSGQVLAPTFDPSGGVFADQVAVTIASATAGATIRYTTDGTTTPSSTTGTVYTGPLHLTTTTTLKAVAIKNNMADSSTREARFINDPSHIWSPLANGVTGTFDYVAVRAMTVYNGQLIVGGTFDLADGVRVNGIASWDGSHWSALSTGMNDGILTLTVFNGELIAGGWFTTAGGVNANRIASWNGSRWRSLGSGVGGKEYPSVSALCVYKGQLFAGGYFATAGGLSCPWVARWDGTQWSPLLSGMDERVYAMTIYDDKLIIGGLMGFYGQFYQDIVATDGARWSPLGAGMDSTVYALTVYNGQLIAGGFFVSAGGNQANGIASWDGTRWSPVGSTSLLYPHSTYALTVYNELLIAGGVECTLPDGSTAHCVSRWDGMNWSTMSTGMATADEHSPVVWALAVYNGQLIAGGHFASASGVQANGIASWSVP